MAILPDWAKAKIPRSAVLTSVEGPSSGEVVGYKYVNSASVQYVIGAPNVWGEGRIYHGEILHDGTDARVITDNWLGNVTMTQEELFALKDPGGNLIAEAFLRAWNEALLAKFAALPPVPPPIIP